MLHCFVQKSKDAGDILDGLEAYLMEKQEQELNLKWFIYFLI